MKADNEYFEELLKSIMFKEVINKNYYTFNVYEEIKKMINHIPHPSLSLEDINYLYHFKSEDIKPKNTAIGMYASNLLTTGSNGVAIGSYALQACTSETESIAIGYNALNDYNHDIELKDNISNVKQYGWYLGKLDTTIGYDTKGLFCFAYYLNYHSKKIVEDFIKKLKHLNILQTINGYSLISATILSKANIETKRFFIHLIGISPTTKDLDLAKRVFYENILNYPVLLIYELNLVKDLYQMIIKLLIDLKIQEYIIL